MRSDAGPAAAGCSDAGHGTDPGRAATDEPGQPRVRITSPADVLAVVPHLLGFHPARSLVVIGAGGPRDRVRFGCRYDLPDPPDPAAAARIAEHAVRVLTRERLRTVIVVGYGPGRLVTPLADVLAPAVRQAGLTVREMLRAEDGRYWSYLCSQPGCCPAEGVPFDVSSHPVAAAMTMAGVPAYPDRATLERSLAPVTGRAAELMAAAISRAYDRAGELVARAASGGGQIGGRGDQPGRSGRQNGGRRDQPVRSGVQAGRSADQAGRGGDQGGPGGVEAGRSDVEAGRSGDQAGRSTDQPGRSGDQGGPSGSRSGRRGRGRPHQGGALRLFHAEGTRAVRETIAAYRAGSAVTDDQLAWLAVALTDLRVRDDAWARMEPAYREAHLRLWTDLVRRVEPVLVPAPASLLAFVAWQSGNGALAGMAIGRALAADPGYSLALLLADIIAAGIPPSAARLPMTPEEVERSYAQQELRHRRRS